MRYNGFPPYVSVAEKKAKAEKRLKALQKKNPGIRPVVLEGQALAKSWWGKSWNKNLERYADYHNRIGRGRSYLRHGAVLDLQITPGEVRATVQGSTTKPYQVIITIKPITKARWLDIKKECQGKLDSLPELLAGKFPTGLQEVFMREGAGIFPTPKEIQFDCSCPDWASMCKHVAAALYGIGARLDVDPSLFFTLRNVDVDELISTAVKETTAKILTKSATKSAKVINDSDLAGLFGISMEAPDFLTAPGKHTPSSPAVKTVARQKIEKPIKASTRAVKEKIKSISVIKKPRKPSTRGLPEPLRKLIAEKIEKRLAAQPSINCLMTPAAMANHVLTIIRKQKNGISVADLSTASGCPKQKLYSIVYRLKLQGEIKSLGHGIYGRG